MYIDKFISIGIIRHYLCNCDVYRIFAEDEIGDSMGQLEHLHFSTMRHLWVLG